MWKDPIVAEIHEIREKIAQEYGDDLHAICEAARRGDLSKSSVHPLSAPVQESAPPVNSAARSIR
jgi:hypothetical protein